MSLRTVLSTAILSLMPQLVFPPLQAAETGFLNREFTNGDGSKSKYVLFIPHDYSGDKKLPLILFLHGAGETGHDGQKQVQVGLGPAIKKREKAFPFIAIFPQASSGETPVRKRWWAESPDGKRALAILNQTMQEYTVDTDRIYLTGLSMGGFGTWNMAATMPEKWAAIVPICGGGNPETAKRFNDLPCWCFHGDADRAVDVDRSRDMITALKQAGGTPKYTEYPGVGHNSWDKAYGTPDLYTWLLAQKRSDPK